MTTPSTIMTITLGIATLGPGTITPAMAIMTMTGTSIATRPR
jgi:hypothetical protein